MDKMAEIERLVDAFQESVETVSEFDAIFVESHGSYKAQLDARAALMAAIRKALDHPSNT